jgi:hypothetical protein
MKIEVKKVTETTEVVEVEFPLYRKVFNHSGQTLLFFKAENDYVDVRDGLYSKGIYHQNCKHYDGILLGMESNEAEFLEAYNRVQSELTIEFHNQFSTKIV